MMYEAAQLTRVVVERLLPSFHAEDREQANGFAKGGATDREQANGFAKGEATDREQTQPRHRSPHQASGRGIN